MLAERIAQLDAAPAEAEGWPVPSAEVLRLLDRAPAWGAPLPDEDAAEAH